MSYYFPFGNEVKPLIQEDRSPKKVFALGVYASAVHARWMKDGKVLCQALAVASEPRTWCSFCPMGTMTQMICQIKAKEKL